MTLRRAAPCRPLLAAVLVLGLAGCSGGADDPFNFGPVFSSPTGPQERGVWVKADAGPQAREAAIDECRTVARAQIERDRQIDRDQQVGSATVGVDQPGADLTRQLRDYSQDNRQRRLFQDCMRDKGWRLD
ncbi:hypothetical protein [Rhodovibrio salinarum]|uniref:Lipoprotein n=1 Tax=Rhodovibrio salinarum TaxID=1087 RepID=A0A934QG03_9PROT|nr:hypothetical protein [Rhodovibrio salinarum]MBK1696307.1 hypothetical protein [Rhodovibrio salinarum]